MPVQSNQARYWLVLNLLPSLGHDHNILKDDAQESACRQRVSANSLTNAYEVQVSVPSKPHTSWNPVELRMPVNFV
ncbi:MAG: hypothetical protein MAG581_02107 [Deltaproteobacteria bacterium]|nr:hypothetical protein [Deltaproteobacteria bacterium]